MRVKANKAVDLAGAQRHLDKGLPTPPLKQHEINTGRSLEAHLEKKLYAVQGCDGADFIDDCGNFYDAIGAPALSSHGNMREFLNQLIMHINKAGDDFAVIDYSGMSRWDKGVIRNTIGRMRLDPNWAKYMDNVIELNY